MKRKFMAYHHIGDLKNYIPTATNEKPSMKSNKYYLQINVNIPLNFYRCTVHFDIHTIHSPTDANLLKL